MLQSIRDIAHSWVVKGLMLFLIVSFAIWGIGDMFRGNTLRKAVAKVGGTEISVQYLNMAFEKALVEVKKKLDPNMTAQQARQMGLLDQTLDREITKMLLDMDIKRQGIIVGPEVVLDILGREPQFRTPDGKFNKQLFSRFLDQQRMSEGMFIAQGQQDLSRQLLLDSIDLNTFAPETEVNALYKARAQKRILDVVTIDAAKLGGIPSPDAATLQEYYDDNQKMFTAPEYRSFTVATLSADALASDISISDEQLKKEYDARGSELAASETRDIVQVVTRDGERAKQIAGLARAARNLPATAANLKETAVPLNGLENNSLMPSLSKVIFAMREGDVSDAIQTQLGWHIIQLKKISRGGVPEFNKIKNKLREDLRREQAIEEATRAVNMLDDKLAAGNPLEDIAEALRLRVVKIPAMDSKGLLPNGKESAKFPNKERVLELAFAQNVGDTSPVEDDKTGSYYVVRTDDITPSGARPFAEVKGQVAAAWKAHEQKLKAQAKAEKIAKALSEGTVASSFNSEEGVSVRTSEALSLLGDTDKQLPSSLIARAFQIKKGQAITEDAGDRQFVVRLSGIMDVDASKEDSRKGLISREIKKAQANELVEQYILHLRTVFPVKTNDKLLETLRQRE
ncbi:MAG: SurA N-terminal domain-containing protein [Bdellovibrionales bacterium]